jgi:hypothetical protein
MGVVVEAWEADGLLWESCASIEPLDEYLLGDLGT